MTTEYTEALASAQGRRLEALTRPGAPPADPDAGARSALRAMLHSPGAMTADALMATCPASLLVAVDPATLEPTSEPLAAYDEVLTHYSQRHMDGVGLLCGPQRDGSTLVALASTAAAYASWLADVGTETRVRDDDGMVSTSRSYLDPGRVECHWQPPPLSVRSTEVAVGRRALEALGSQVRSDRGGADEVGYVARCVAPRPGERLTFKSKRVADGVEMLGEGDVLPMAASRPDGWRLTSSGVPQGDEMPGWLLAVLGGRWVKA